MAEQGNEGFKMSQCSFQPPTKVEIELARGRRRTRSMGFVFKGVEGGGRGGRAGLSTRQLGMRTRRRTALIMDNNACDTRPKGI